MSLLTGEHSCKHGTRLADKTTETFCPVVNGVVDCCGITERCIVNDKKLEKYEVKERLVKWSKKYRHTRHGDML